MATTKKTVKVKNAPKAPTRHRPAPRAATKPTRLQRQGEEALRREESAARLGSRQASRNRNRKSLAYRASHKIKSKHKILRPAAYLIVGALVGVGKGTKWTGIGVGKASKWTGLRVGAKVRTDFHRRKWVPEAERPQNVSRFARYTQLACACGKTCSSAESLNRHLVEKHRGEAKSYAKPRAKIVRGHTRRTAGKVIVRPGSTGGAGRHRTRHNLPSSKRVDALVAAHRNQLTKIGDLNMASDTSAANALKRAAKALSDTPRPETPRDFSEFCAGIERAFGAFADAIADWDRMLTRPATLGDTRGANIDPALVKPHTRAMREHAHQLGSDFTRLVAAFYDYYGTEIRAARTKKTPNMDLSKTG